MSTLLEVEKLAFDLPESQRATLAAHLLESLPPVLHDEDAGLAEALLQDRELDGKGKGVREIIDATKTPRSDPLLPCSRFTF